MTTKTNTQLMILFLLGALALAGCRTENDTQPNLVQLQNHSVNPSLVKALPGFESLQIFPLISSDDKLAESPNFVFGAQPDGAGLMKDPAGKGYIMLNNHEITQAVSRVYLDETFKPTKGEYIVDATGGRWRLCSATLATPEEHGFGPVFLTVGESGPESMVHAISPTGPAADKSNKERVKKALGKASMENAVPLPKDTYAGKTVIVIGEDQGPANGYPGAGQVLLYVANTVGDLDNGKLYFLRRANQDMVETSMKMNETYDVEFVEVSSPAKAASEMTGLEIAQRSVDTKAVQFARVEDLDYRRGSAAAHREIYFTATGVAESGGTRSPIPGYNKWSRVYRFYIQEDGDSFYPGTGHDGRIWQYSIASKTLKPMIEMDHHRTDATFNAKYNPSNDTRLSSWEYGAMYDISELIGIPDVFVVNIHPHTWRDEKYRNPDGSGLVTNTEGGQTVIVRGVAR